MSIHHSMSLEDDGYFVATWFVYLIIGLVLTGLLGTATMAWLMYNMYAALDFTTYNAVTTERRRASDEMLTKRARVLSWTYERACESERAKGKPCLENPELWANPVNYPTLLQTNGGSGAGLLPPLEDPKLNEPK